MKRVLAFVLIFVLVLPARADDAAYANMQRAVGGIIQQQAAARGLSPTDPRTYGTLYGVGKVAVSGAAGVGTGLLVAGTSPGWITVLALAALGSAVSYAVSLGIDAAVKWAFGSGSTPVTVSGTNSGGTGSSGAAMVAGSWYYMAYGYAAGSADASFYAYFRDPANGFCGGGKCAPNSSGYVEFRVASVVNMPYGSGTTNRYYIESHVVYTNGTSSAWSSMGSVMPTLYDSGAPRTCDFQSYSLNGGACTLVPPDPAAGPTTKTLADAIASLTSDQKAQKVSYDTMAMMVNQLVSQAAADPSYAGIPQSLSQPFVTAADVQAWANANPSAYPTVGALVAPVTDSSGLIPSTSTSPTTAVAPATSVTPNTAVNPAQSSPQINLGADPVVPLPSLETTPTAQMILNPLLGLFPDLKNFVVPSHVADCPKPSLSLFGRAMVMDGHCSLLDSARPTIYAVMAAVWIVVALFIILAA